MPKNWMSYEQQVELLCRRGMSKVLVDWSFVAPDTVTPLLARQIGSHTPQTCRTN